MKMEGSADLWSVHKSSWAALNTSYIDWFVDLWSVHKLIGQWSIILGIATSLGMYRCWINRKWRHLWELIFRSLCFGYMTIATAACQAKVPVHVPHVPLPRERDTRLPLRIWGWSMVATGHYLNRTKWGLRAADIVARQHMQHIYTLPCL